MLSPRSHFPFAGGGGLKVNLPTHHRALGILT